MPVRVPRRRGRGSPDEREHCERAGNGKWRTRGTSNGGNGGRCGKDCRITHGDEGEGVILYSNGLLPFFQQIRVEVLGGSGLEVETSFDVLLLLSFVSN